MTSITQKIPNFIGGISQQPDELMPLGSVKDAVNVIPDVTDGLRKRSGSRLINPILTNEFGSWFHFNYSDDQKYIGKINYNGSVQVFNCADGMPVVVNYKEWEQDPLPSTGYPSCNASTLGTTKQAWLDKKNELSTKEIEYNVLITQKKEQEGGEDVLTYFKILDSSEIVPGAPSGQPGVVEGYTRRSGPDTQAPKTPEGYSSRRGKLRETYTTPIVSYDADSGKWEYSRTAEIYELEFYKATEVDPTLEQTIRDLRVEIDTLQAEVDTLYDIYMSEAEKCGYTSTPVLTKSVIDSDVPPDYLRHNTPQQIKNLVVGDTIFFVNPAVTTSMAESAFPKRATENYIELKTIAASKVYTLELIDEVSQGSAYTVVTKVSVLSGEYKDADSACIYQGTSREVHSSGSKQNLDLTLTVTGYQSLEGNGNSLSDYVCLYSSKVDINNGGTGWVVGDVVEMTIAGKKYKIKVEETDTIYSSQGQYVIPTQTPDSGVIKAETILADIETAIKTADPAFITKIIGNGIYVTHPDPDYAFTFSTPEGQLMSVTTNQVNNIAELPTQCRDGYIVKIANTDSDYDDYWAIFETEYKGMDGPGSWVETVEPGLNTTINPMSMPHKMVRSGDGTFTVSPIDWDRRLVGDEKTNPKPSFVSRVGKGDLRTISAMAFFRNRLCLLSGDNVVCSRPGDYYNFWNGSALAQVDNDPIDIAVGSSSSSANATLYDAIEVSDGLVVFSANEQHLLSTDSEVFGPTTARFNRIGTYRYSGQNRIDVFSLGTSIGFMGDSGINSRLMEMYNINRQTDANINELSKPVSRLMPFNIDLLADSKDNNLIALSRRGQKEIWIYRYFDNDQRRVQSAWFKWRMLGNMVYHCIMDDVYWSISMGTSSSINIPPENREIISLQRIDLKDELATAFVYDKYEPSAEIGVDDTRIDNGAAFQAHLDNYRIALPSEFQYYPHLKQTYFRAPLIYYKDQKLVAYMLSPTVQQRDSGYTFARIGGAIDIRVEEDRLGTWFVLDGDWSDTRMMIGYEYEMKIEFPTLYVTQTKNVGSDAVVRSDTRGSLTINRIKLNFGQTGVFQTTIKRLGRDDYTEMYECKTMDDYPANEIAFDQRKTQTVPIYSKNTDTTIYLNSFHPSPATLFSMEWEGQYTNRYYKRV